MEDLVEPPSPPIPSGLPGVMRSKSSTLISRSKLSCLQATHSTDSLVDAKKVRSILCSSKINIRDMDSPTSDTATTEDETGMSSSGDSHRSPSHRSRKSLRSRSQLRIEIPRTGSSTQFTSSSESEDQRRHGGGSAHAHRPQIPSSYSEVGYGWFDDYEEHDDAEALVTPQHDHMAVLNRMESMQSLAVSSRSESPTGSQTAEKLVLFTLNQKQFTITTKAFEDLSTSPPRSYFLAMGLGGFRIVQTEAGQHAEFNLIVVMNSQSYCIWKRYNNFCTLLKQAQRCHTRRQLKKTQEAWDTLEKRRPWWRCLHVLYLTEKYALLEVFLKELVYEIKSPALLVRFASGRRDQPLY